ncbi:unnamed protein product, partial [Discosporangium mesarthrocarpum]
ETYYEADEEELEEERQDSAAVLIQGLFRAKRARKLVRELVKSNFVKEIDPRTGRHLYRNRRTGEVSPEKPAFLGSDDLQTPRSFGCPEDYDPGKSSMPQFALVITNSIFESQKIPNLPQQVEQDHIAIREALEHPFYAKFEPENCFFVKNASKDLLKGSLATFAAQISSTMSRLEQEAVDRGQKQSEQDYYSRSSTEGLEHGEEGSEHKEEEKEEEEEEEKEFKKEEALLLIYVCTHVAHVTKGKGTAGIYLVGSDTSWQSKETVARTSLRLEDFAKAIASVQV